MTAHTQENFDNFYRLLTEAYADLFVTSDEYAYAATQTTPAELARKMTIGLDTGSANKDGEGIRRVCKKLGIPHTYKAIRAYLSEK